MAQNSNQFYLYRIILSFTTLSKNKTKTQTGPSLQHKSKWIKDSDTAFYTFIAESHHPYY